MINIIIIVFLKFYGMIKIIEVKFMSLEFELPLFSFIFILILIFVYFSKPKIGLKENKCFEIILIASVIEILLDTIIHFICALHDFSIIVQTYYPLLNFLNKVLIILFIIIFLSLLCYTLIISYEEIRKNTKKIIIGCLVILGFSMFLLLFTNVTLIEVGNVTNVKGSTTAFGYLMVAIMLISSLLIALKNIKKIDQRYFPIFCIIFLLGFLYVITIIFPGIIIYDIVLSLLCYIMYFTIENPDLQMLNEFRQAKKYADNLNMQKAEFLFDMASEIKEPIRTINLISKKTVMENDIDIIKKNVNEIKYSSNNLLELVNKVLDISNIEFRKVSVRESKYNIDYLFKEIDSQMNIKLKDSVVNFHLKYDNSIPKELYGDSIRIRQIINTLLENSIKYTKEGFIELNVNFVVKYDICRLIITVEDSGIGIRQEKIEHLFEKQEEEIVNIENSKMNLRLVKTLLDLIGGTIAINSELNHGTKFTLVIDQKIVQEKKSKTIEIAEKYEQLYEKKRKILLVVKDNNLEVKFKKVLKKENIDVSTVIGGQACLEQVRNGNVFDLIIIEDELEKLSSEATLLKLKQIEGFQVPVVLLTRKVGILSKKEYMEKGFTDVYIVPLSKGNIKEIIDDYC